MILEHQHFQQQNIFHWDQIRCKGSWQDELVKHGEVSYQEMNVHAQIPKKSQKLNVLKYYKSNCSNTSKYLDSMRCNQFHDFLTCPLVKKRRSDGLLHDISLTSNLNCSSRTILWDLASMNVTRSSLLPTAMVLPSGAQAMLIFSPLVGMVAIALVDLVSHMRTVLYDRWKVKYEHF